MTLGNFVTDDLIAAVDLGSNSFRLQVGRVVGNQVYLLDGLKEPVRLAAGLDAHRMLNEEAQERALEALRRFGERLQGFRPGRVRAVATDTFRVAQNAESLLQKAREALGVPVEVISGREEARLIYMGVAQAMNAPPVRQLVVDIGGGSTEFIIGERYNPLQLESLHMGCISHTQRHFPKGRLHKSGFKDAELAARKEMETLVEAYTRLGWKQAVGSSGTAKSIADLLAFNGLNPPGCIPGTITLVGLERLKTVLLSARHTDHLHLEGLRPDRVAVLPGGLAILLAVFKTFRLDRMQFSEGALRQGVLYDLLGRHHHEDLREETVNQFMQRYAVDRRQAARISQTALGLLEQLLPKEAPSHEIESRFLVWAARLHEVGIFVAHSGYQKHGAYILANADMPGFSKTDQDRLSRLVLSHRGKLERVQSITNEMLDWLLIFCLRLSSVLHRARGDAPSPRIHIHSVKDGFHLLIDEGWLKRSSLATACLEEEAAQWKSLGMEMKIRSHNLAEGEGGSSFPLGHSPLTASNLSVRPNHTHRSNRSNSAGRT